MKQSLHSAAVDGVLGELPGAASVKATLLGGVQGNVPLRRVTSVSATLLGTGAVAQPPLPVELEEREPLPTPNALPRGTMGRTTVLPRRMAGQASHAFQMQQRYQRVKTLGEGAMGRVELVRDNDIRRTVAVKQLLGGSESAESLARFADEIRVVGQLEHPGIVPIYDVDRGEDGQVYLVMKHLQGETMEEVIARLQAGSAPHLARFTIEYRVRLFLGVLDAMAYAHARGVLHRDLKPANIMIGPYGEVTVMDWGIAKPLGARAKSTGPDPLGRTLADSHDRRLLETTAGALAGTPLYMSPEQAAAQNDDLDERSDIYTLCIVLYEWLVLRHPLQDKQSVPEVLATLVLHDYTAEQLFLPAQAAQVPMEYIWIIYGGLVRAREKRFQSVGELEAALKAVQGGKIKVQCRITLAKSYAQRFVHWIDRHPALYLSLFRGFRVLAIVLPALGLALGAWRLLR